MSIVAALTLTIAVSGITYAAAPAIDSGAKGKIEGSGATFPWNQYKDWFSSFTDENSDKFSVSDASAKLVLNYTGGGSGAGIANFYGSNAGLETQMFSGTDAVLSSSDRSAIAATSIGSNYTVIPIISGPLAVVYRVDGLKKGGVLNIVAHELELIATPDSIPDDITVDVTGLEVGASIHLKDIAIPAGVKVVTHEADATIATIVAPSALKSEEGAAEAGEA